MPGSTPAAGFVPGAASAIPPMGAVPPVMPPQPVPSGPNPTVAGILAGVFPFGVGAVYTGQYAKGLAHLAIFALLFAGCSAASESSHGELLGVICGLGLAFFYVYQIIDAVRSARALQAGLPPPDPYGLAASFGGGSTLGGSGAKPGSSSKLPVSAIVLILLGAVFLLHTAGLFEVNFHRFWGVILILLGGWIYATRSGLIGTQKGCPCQRCRAQCLMGPAILVTVGVIGLIDSFHDVGFFGYVGGILLVVGGVRLMQGTSSAQGHIPSLAACANPPAGPTPPVTPTPPAPPVPPTSEVNNG